MKYLYPAASKYDDLTPQQIALKIARHCSCTACENCKGLHPSPGVEVVLYNGSGGSGSVLGQLGQYGSDDDEEMLPYLDICACGHSVAEHGADESQIDAEEYHRRASYAIRIDENLQDEDMLLDFAYSDPDVDSLRKRMIIAPVSTMVPAAASLSQLSKSPSTSSSASALSDLPPPHKKRRISMSSLSGDDNDDDDEEPLATRMAPTTSSQSLAKPSKTAKSTVAAGRMPVANGKTNGFVDPEPTVKVEEKLDDAQLDLLATGVPVDSETTAPPVKAEKAAAVELRKGIIQIIPVKNDRQPKSMILMTGLKTLFQKQLPKMPRDYIARLVYDDSSRALGIVKRGFKVVGGICFRPFPQRGFAEIVFFATASVDQVKGYGAMLMDHFKMHIRVTYPGMNYFLTYADNYAVGYFEKQGFSKEITLDRSVWAGYIKDYEGGTIMQCTLLDKVDYLDKANILAQQQEAIMSKIRQMSRSHIVHPGLPQFREGAEADVKVEPEDVPGLRETGWTPSMAEKWVFVLRINSRLIVIVLGSNGSLVRLIPKSPDRHFMERLMKDLQEHNQAWPFLLPVPADEVPDYYECIKNPMDFSTMEHKLDDNQYLTVEDFANDARLVFQNCRAYNAEDSIYHKMTDVTPDVGWLRHALSTFKKRRVESNSVISDENLFKFISPNLYHGKVQ
ncbi:hypothetical protein D9757_000734 [Collybiopsis confluens]|uniref:histone acetyltransferase n=1 Tax=Collybiopsis confluens TaxID=2823264 RepID=A0A8H5I1N2_9AGAR|nr:hypothetical protein D9757_000734 [Collybiopsis confluens]